MPTSLRGAALLAAAAVLGALVGFGVREGAPFVPLGGAGLRLRGLPEFVTPDRAPSAGALLGAVHVGVVAYAWGLVAAAAARGRSTWRATAALLALATVLVLVDPLLPAALRLGAGSLSTGQRAVCALVLVLAAGLGTRRVGAPPRASRPPRAPAPPGVPAPAPVDAPRDAPPELSPARPPEQSAAGPADAHDAPPHPAADRSSDAAGGAHAGPSPDRPGA